MMMIDVLRPHLRPLNEVKDETPFRYAHTEIRTQVVVICGPTRYQLDHGGSILKFDVYLNEIQIIPI